MDRTIDEYMSCDQNEALQSYINTFNQYDRMYELFVEGMVLESEGGGGSKPARLRNGKPRPAGVATGTRPSGSRF